jgi:hypothetical protein
LIGSCQDNFNKLEIVITEYGNRGISQPHPCPLLKEREIFGGGVYREALKSR